MLKEKLKDRHIILASGSPRRQQFFRDLGLDFEVRLKDTKEDYSEHLLHYQISDYLAELKAIPFFEELEDKELAIFYKNLMVSEANHYTMFLGFARKYGDRKEVDEKWQQLLEYEAEIMRNLSKSETIHG